MMRLALSEARHAFHLGEVPIGAVLARDQDVVAVGFNQPIQTVDPTAHAELIAIRKAAREIGNYRVTDTTLYVTVEPCMMCVGALLQARISTLVYGVAEPKFGAVQSLFNLEDLRIPHRPTVVSGILEQDCKKILQDFFKARRKRD